jgi:hypothetical protein
MLLCVETRETTALSLAEKGTVVSEKRFIRTTLARVRAFISANDSFCYRQLQQQSVRTIVSALRCCQVSSIIERPVSGQNRNAVHSVQICVENAHFWHCIFFFADAAIKHEVELTSPKSIAELPEKLLLSGIQLPGRFRYLFTYYPRTTRRW